MNALFKDLDTPPIPVATQGGGGGGGASVIFKVSYFHEINTFKDLFVVGDIETLELRKFK